MKEISVEELVKLKEQGKNPKQISKYYREQGIVISTIDITNRLYEYYNSIGFFNEKSQKSREITSVSGEELAKLRSEEWTNKQIVEYYEKQGIKVSETTIYRKLKNYYELNGIEMPKIKKQNNSKINISGEKLSELKNKGMTNKQIFEYYKEQGIEISESTISKRLMEYYELNGIEKPIIKRKRKWDIPNNRKKNIPGEELVKLRNQGMIYKQISKNYEERGIKISESTVYKILKEYYELNGIEMPKIKKQNNRIKNILGEELENLRNQGMTYKQISKYYEERGIEISESTISKRLMEYYELNGIEKPIINKQNNRKINISGEELVELIKQGMTYKQICEYYYKERGMNIYNSIITTKLKEYYDSQGIERPKNNNNNKIDIPKEELIGLREQKMTIMQIIRYYREKGIKVSKATISKKIREYYDKKELEKPSGVLKRILMSGSTIQDFCKKNEIDSEPIEVCLKRLKVLAEHSGKMGDSWIKDESFLEVIELLENKNSSQMYVRDFEKYMYHTNKKWYCKGKITLIRNEIFKRNNDLMTFILNGYNIKYEENDKEVRRVEKQNFKQKINIYFSRLNSLEEKFQLENSKKPNTKKVANDQNKGEER